jgi:hypothetical protein
MISLTGSVLSSFRVECLSFQNLVLHLRKWVLHRFYALYHQRRLKLRLTELNPVSKIPLRRANFISQGAGLPTPLKLLGLQAIAPRPSILSSAAFARIRRNVI